MSTPTSDDINHNNNHQAGAEPDTAPTHPVREQDDNSPSVQYTGNIPIIPPGFKEWSSPSKPPSSKSLKERIDEAREKIKRGEGFQNNPDFKLPTAIIWTIHDPIAICPIDENEGAELPEFSSRYNAPAGGNGWKWHPDVVAVDRFRSAQHVSEVSETVGQQQEDQEP